MTLNATCYAAVAALCVTATIGRGARQAPKQAPGQSDRLTAEVLKGLEFRSIGPAISTGRVQDIAVDPKSPNTWYVATACAVTFAGSRKEPAGVTHWISRVEASHFDQGTASRSCRTGGSTSGRQDRVVWK